jgi:holin-like protein
VVLQLLLLAGFWGAGQALTAAFALPIPGAIVSMLTILALLGTGALRLRSLRRGAYWLLAEMLLFFVPAVPAVLDHHEFLGWLGLKILVVILVGTLLVMLVTALTVELCCRPPAAVPAVVND